VPPYSHNGEWIHHLGVGCVLQHHKVDDRYLMVKLYFEEMGQEAHIGYVTNHYAIYKWNNWNIRYPLFNLMIWKPALEQLNVTPRLILGCWLNRKLDPLRLVIGFQDNSYFATIGYQTICATFKK
jgi:hypothetical protein